MFNNIRLVRYNKAGTIEIERITVPLSYADKEKFYKRITQDPELTKETMLTLPRMAFSLDSITYDPLRKTSIYNKQFSQSAVTGQLKTIQATPYNFDFSLSIYVRNVEDGTQIIEQILPYFNPDYTLSINLTTLDSKIDVPLILNSVSQDNQADGVPDNTRVITWNLTFTMKGYIYGPINSTAKVIRQVSANTFGYNTSNIGVKQLILENGSGNYKIGELVFEGRTVSSANATAYVESWNNKSNTIMLVDVNGIIQSGAKLTGVVSNAGWDIASYELLDYKLKSLQVTPNPSTANSDDDFGYTTTVTDFTDGTTTTHST